MRRFSEIGFAVVSTLLVTAVTLQLYFAGLGVFSDPTDELFAIHGWNGRIVLPLLTLLTVLLAALARAGKRTIRLSVLVFGLLILQTLIFVLTGLIFGIGPETPNPPLIATMFVSLHPINGLAILTVSFLVARRAHRLAFARSRRIWGAGASSDEPTDEFGMQAGSPRDPAGPAGAVPAARRP